MLLVVLYCRMILQTFSWKLRRAAECRSGHVGKWYNLAVFSGVIQNPYGAEVLRQAGCENFLTMAFSSPSGIKRAPGDLNCTPFVGQYGILLRLAVPDEGLPADAERKRHYTKYVS